MFGTKLFSVATMAAALIAAPRDGCDRRTGLCGLRELRATPCNGATPTTDQVVAVMAKLTDPDIPATNRTNMSPPGSPHTRLTDSPRATRARSENSGHSNTVHSST